MISIVNGRGDVIRELTETEEKAYNALESWQSRLQRWEYAKQVKKNKGRRLKQFFPNTVALEISDVKRELGTTITPEEAMAYLWNPHIRAEINACIDAGF